MARRTAAQLDAAMEAERERSKRKMDQLRAQKQKLEASERAQERKYRNHALMVFGGLVEKYAGGDWRDIDCAKLERYLDQYQGAIKKSCRVAERSATPKESAERIRNWEAAKRAPAKAKAAEAPADTEGTPWE